jgi:outer membrane lipopolysaccharide assembly protein LptE/RlpB
MINEGKNVKLKMNKKHILSLSSFLAFLFLMFNLMTTTGCGVYRFNDVSIPDSIKTVRINFIENRARYVNPQISPQLTDRVKQKINNQTKMTQTNGDNAHLEISGTITDYTVSTSGISQQQAQTNRLTVGLHITVNNHLGNKVDEYDVSRSFEFPSTSSLQAAEAGLMDEMVRSLTDDIFNRIFSNW